MSDALNPYQIMQAEPGESLFHPEVIVRSMSEPQAREVWKRALTALGVRREDLVELGAHVVALARVGIDGTRYPFWAGCVSAILGQVVAAGASSQRQTSQETWEAGGFLGGSHVVHDRREGVQAALRCVQG